jgi:KDO2-lipid IV(A) lauroyltransferase
MAADPTETAPRRRRGPWRRAGDIAADGAFRGVLAVARTLPYERRVAFMGALLRRAAGPLAGYRARALDNLALVRPDWSAARRREVADACLDNFGRTLAEMYSGPEFWRRAAAAPLSGGGLPHLERAVAEGRPVLFVTGHFGNHEVPRIVLQGRGHRIGGLYRETDNPAFNRHYIPTMTSVPGSGPGFAKGRRGVAGFVRHLRGGGLATLLFDLHEKGGAPIPFLGRPARTATTAAELALRFGAVILPYWGLRRPDGLSFDAILEEPVAHGEPLEMMREMTLRLERQIGRDPGQWFWVHRRWKG